MVNGAIVSQRDSATGELAIVNRANSYFGAGWWLAGLERLYPSTMVWVGGDGSIRKYTSAGTNVWAAPGLAAPDTIKRDTALNQYVRYLPGGTQVRFDADGKHIATVPRLGTQHQTRFAYNTGSMRLDTIALPIPSGGTARNYVFAYTSGMLSSVTAPAIGSATPRVTNLAVTSGRVTSIQDPVHFSDPFGLQPCPDRVVFICAAIFRLASPLNEFVKNVTGAETSKQVSAFLHSADNSDGASTVNGHTSTQAGEAVNNAGKERPHQPNFRQPGRMRAQVMGR